MRTSCCFHCWACYKARTALRSVVLSHRGKGGGAACPLELGDCRGYCHLFLEDLEAASEDSPCLLRGRPPCWSLTPQLHHLLLLLVFQPQIPSESLISVVLLNRMEPGTKQLAIQLTQLQEGPPPSPRALSIRVLIPEQGRQAGKLEGCLAG